MKNLVLGALLAAAISSTACGTSDTSAVITASWSFNTYDNRMGAPTAPCPPTFDTATVYVRPWDPFVGDFTGPAIASDLFDCEAKSGTTDPLDGIFQVWVQIENRSGSSVYAASESEVIDTADGDATIHLPTLYLNAGYFDLSWDLEQSGRRVHCSEAAVGTGGDITTTASVVTSPSTIFTSDPASCSDGFGVFGPFLEDNYDITVTASSGPGHDVGASDPIADVQVTAPDGPKGGLTHLGVITIHL